MAESVYTPTPPPLRVLDAVLAHPSPTPGPALDAVLAHSEQTLPSSDDTPLPDGRIQEGPLVNSRASLRHHFRGQSDRIAVEGDTFVHYIGQDEDGEPEVASVAPDIFVVFGVPDRPDRNSYVLFNEPDADIRFVLEIASQSTRARDHGQKRCLYASLGIPEYFLYDPPTARRPARVMGLTLSGTRYQELPQEILTNGRRGVRSNVLQLAVYVHDDRLCWYDPVSGRELIDIETAHLKAEETEAAREEAAAARDRAARAEARVAELEALLKDRGDMAKPR